MRKSTILKNTKVKKDVEHDNRQYVEFPDGLRLIFENGKYVGYYNCCADGEKS